MFSRRKSPIICIWLEGPNGFVVLSYTYMWFWTYPTGKASTFSWIWFLLPSETLNIFLSDVYHKGTCPWGLSSFITLIQPSFLYLCNGNKQHIFCTFNTKSYIFKRMRSTSCCPTAALQGRGSLLTSSAVAPPISRGWKGPQMLWTMVIIELTVPD